MLELVRVTETAALRAGRCMGMGNLNLVDDAAVDGMRGMLSLVNIKGNNDIYGGSLCGAYAIC